MEWQWGQGTETAVQALDIHCQDADHSKELGLLLLLLALEGLILPPTQAEEKMLLAATCHGSPGPSSRSHLESLPDAMQLCEEILVAVAAKELCPRGKGLLKFQLS